MAAIKHDNVASIFSIEDREAGPYIVMECVVGESLEARLKRKSPIQVSDIIARRFDRWSYRADATGTQLRGLPK